MARKMLNQLISKPSIAYSKSSTDGYDESLLDDKIPACFHLNYIMDSSNPECQTFPLCQEPDPEGELPMNFCFLNESTIDDIILNYSQSKSGYYQLLVKCVEESRDKLDSLIDLYSADLNVKTFYSEKGLKERKQRIKFQCLASKNKENFVEAAPISEKKNKGIFGDMTDFDKCLQILIVHNSKVQKILDKVSQAYQDRQNGVARPPSPPESKPKGKKIVKKAKKNAIDITIKFKSEDGHVEEIVVKDKAKKKLKPKKKVKGSKSKTSSFKTSTDDDNQSIPEADPKPEKTIELLSKNN